MPQRYRVNYSLRAAEQIHEIIAYIEQNSPVNAAKMTERIIEAIESLDLFPHRFNLTRNPAALGESIRSLSVRPYLIRYQINESNLTVTIVSIRHGARLPGL
jgi:plasmid stabilization system protein ParE